MRIHNEAAWAREAGGGVRGRGGEEEGWGGTKGCTHKKRPRRMAAEKIVRHVHPTVALTLNRAHASLIQTRKQFSSPLYTGIGARKASWLSSMSRTFSSFAIASGFINLLIYDVVTSNFSAALLLCLPPLTSAMSCNRRP